MNNTTNTTADRMTVTLPVTLNGETRNVEFTCWGASNKATAFGFAARVGNGTKLHGCEMTAYLRDGVWTTSTATSVLNRQATIVAFRDQVAQQAKSQHRSSSIR